MSFTVESPAFVMWGWSHSVHSVTMVNGRVFRPTTNASWYCAAWAGVPSGLFDRAA